MLELVTLFCELVFSPSIGPIFACSLLHDHVTIHRLSRLIRHVPSDDRSSALSYSSADSTPDPHPLHLHLRLLLLLLVLIARRRDGKGERPCKLTFKSATCYLSRYSSAYDFFFFSLSSVLPISLNRS